jgi:hypothetical protein
MPHKPHLPKDAPKEFRLNLIEGNASRHVAAFLAQRRRFPVPDHFEGSGCVMAAGGRRYLRMAFVTISLIRQSGWDVPIEVWHMGPKELPYDLRRRFEHLDVRFVDAHQVRRHHPARQLGGFELKSFAIAHSGFRHVMLLDADCIPIRDPSDLFESPEYLETGVIVAPDIIKNRKSDAIFTFMGIPLPDDFWEGESGFIMIDKARAWRALELTRWFNDYSDFFYKYVWGDKDSLPLSCLRTETPYRMLPRCTWEPFGIRHYWFDGSVVADHHMDRKRNPGAFVPEQHEAYGRMFDRFDFAGVPEYAQSVMCPS